MDAFIVRKGGRSAPKKQYIVKNGILGEGVTGFEPVVNDPGRVDCGISFPSGSMLITLGGWYNGTGSARIYSDQTFDLSDYKALFFELKYSSVPGESGRYCGAAEATASWSATWAVKKLIHPDTTRRIYGVDIEAIMGRKQITFEMSGVRQNIGNTMAVYNIWLER